MKKLIILLLVVSLCLTGCDTIRSVMGKDPDTGVDVGEQGGSALPGGSETPDTPPADCTSHEDGDDDGLCDLCSESVIVIIDLFAINDLHGKITESDSQPGIGGLTTYLKRVIDEDSVLIASGDMWQGSSESNLTHGKLITDWMGEVGFDAMTIGNHEYDWGDSYIGANAEIAEFPLLAINVYEKGTGERADYAEPSVVITRGEIEIGIIGAIGDVYSSISGEVVGDVYFKVGDELTELVKDEADRLRAEGVDFIIYSIHDGYGRSSSGIKTVSDSEIASYYDIELSDGYVDVVFEAHTHQSYVLRDSEGVYHIQGGGENDGMAHAELKYNEANGNASVRAPEIIRSSVYGNLEDDPLIAELLLKYASEIAPAYRVVGENPSYMSSTVIRQLVAELYYEAGLERWAGEYDVALGGGFISVRNPYELQKGSVTYSDLYSILPFDNQLVLCSVSGYDLYYKFLTTTNRNYFIYSDMLEELKENIDFGATYYIITDTYTSTYAYNNLTEIARYDEGVFARDLLAWYFESIS